MASSTNRGEPLTNLLEIVLSRKLLVIMGFLSVFSIAVIGATLMPPIYNATTTIYISAPTLPQLEVPYMQEVAGRSFLQNQIHIIQSRFILEKIVKKLRLHQIQGQPNHLSKLKDKIYHVLKVARPMPDPIEAAIDYLRESLYVYRSRGTNIVTITVTSKSAEKAALLANTLAQTYIEYASSLLVTKTQSGYSFIEKQVKKVRQKLTVSEKALNAFKEREMVITIPQETSIILTKLTQAEEEYQQIQLQIENLKEQANRAKHTNEEQVAEVIQKDVQYNSPEVQELSEQSKQLRDELNKALVYLKDDHPDVRVMRNRLAKMETNLAQAKSKRANEIIRNSRVKKSSHMRDENIQATETIKKLEQKRDYLANQTEKLLKRREELTRNQFVLEKLTREAQGNQKTLIMLEEKLQDARILNANEMKQGGIKIMDQAFPPPFSIKRKKLILLLIGTIAAIMFSLGMAFIAEYLDDSLKTPEEAKSYLELDVLGVVPKATRKMRRA